MESNRWWEMYLVRYVTGSVVGAVIVYLIMEKIGINLIPCVEDIKGESLFVLGVLGVAYCYLASAPITLLHAMRLIWGKPLDGENKSCTGNAVFIVGTIMVSLIVNAGINHAIPSFGNSGIIIGAFLFFIIFMAFDLFLRTDGNDKWQNEYMKLALARKDMPDFVQSYRHLREHGNAYFIVLLEILLAFPLYAFASLDGAENRVGQVSLLGWGIFFWILSGAFCWLLGNRLERFLVEYPKEGLNS